MDEPTVRTFLPEHYMGMSNEDQAIVDAFLEAVGLLPIMVSQIDMTLHPEWERLAEEQAQING